MTLNIPSGLSIATSSSNTCCSFYRQQEQGRTIASTESHQALNQNTPGLDLSRRVVPSIENKGCYALFGRCFDRMICGYEIRQDIKAKAVFRQFLENTYGNKTAETITSTLDCYTSGSFLTVRDILEAEIVAQMTQKDDAEVANIINETTVLIDSSSAEGINNIIEKNVSEEDIQAQIDVNDTVNQSKVDGIEIELALTTHHDVENAQRDN